MFGIGKKPKRPSGKNTPVGEVLADVEEEYVAVNSSGLESAISIPDTEEKISFLHKLLHKVLARGEDVSYPWICAPNPIPPEWVLGCYQALHLVEPLITFLSLKVAGSRKLFVISAIKTALFSLREKLHGFKKDSVTLLVLVLGITANKFIFGKIKVRKEPLTFLAKILSYVQVIFWGLAYPESIFGLILKLFVLLPVTVVAKKLHQLVPTKLREQTEGLVPLHAKDLTTKWVERGLITSGLFKDDMLPLERINVESISGMTNFETKNQDEKKNEATGFIGDVVRVKLNYRGGSSLDSRLPKSLIVKFSPIGLKYRIISLALRESYFYDKIHPEMLQFQRTVDGADSKRSIRVNMLQTPRPIRVQYDFLGDTCCLLLEDAKTVETSDGKGLQTGDEIKGATWAQACSVAVRYARFHSLFWSIDLQALEQDHQVLSPFRCYDWMDLPSFQISSLINKSIHELYDNEFRGEELTPSLDAQGVPSWGEALKPRHQKVVQMIGRHFPLILKFAKEKSMTLIHADTRYENMFWPEVKETDGSKKLFDNAALDSFYEQDRSSTNTWWAVDWQTTTKGLGVYDLAYFVTMSLLNSPEELTVTHDEALVRLYHEELLRHSKKARDCSYSFEQCFEDYKVCIAMAVMIPLTVMRAQALTQEGYETRGKFVRKKMFQRWSCAVDRLDLSSFLEKLIQERSPQASIVSFLPPKVHEPESLVADVLYEVPLAKFPIDDINSINAYDRWYANAVSIDGTAMMGFALGIYPNRKVMDAALSISVNGVQHSLKSSVHIGRIRDPSGIKSFRMGEQPGTYTITIGPITLEVVEPLKSFRITTKSHNSSLDADVLFTAAGPPVLEPKYDMYISGGGLLQYQRLTQIVRCNGKVRIGSETIEFKEAKALRDRSWGVRPHNVADKTAEANWKSEKMMRSPLGKPISSVLGMIGKPQFYWFWMPISFKNFAMMYHSQQDKHGTVTNGSAKLLGHLPLFPETTDEAAKSDTDDFEQVAQHHVEAASPIVQPMKLNEELEVLSARHEIDLIPSTRHAKSGRVVLKVRRKNGSENEKSSTVEIKFEPQFPFYMQGMGYQHPEFGHGSRMRNSMTTVYDSFATELADRRNLMQWMVEEVCKLTLVVDGKEVDRSVGIVEQFSIGPYKPAGWKGFMD